MYMCQEGRYKIMLISLIHNKIQWTGRLEVEKGKANEQQNLKILQLLEISAKFTCSVTASRVKNRIGHKKAIGEVENKQAKIIVMKHKL